MVVILTNDERDKLIKEYKIPPQKLKTFTLTKKNQVKYRESDIDLIDNQNRKYKMIMRKNTEDINDFTVILRFFHQQEGAWRTLTRYNGYHGIHTNVLEDEEIDGFHIHKITEKYQEANQKDDGFAEITKSYNTFDDALKAFLKDNNIGQIWYNQPFSW
jgi:hypothetical protein